MTKTENECVGCPPEMGCQGSSCPYRNVTRIYCDGCGEEITNSEIFDVDGGEFCEYCLKDMFRREG